MYHSAMRYIISPFLSFSPPHPSHHGYLKCELSFFFRFPWAVTQIFKHSARRVRRLHPQNVRLAANNMEPYAFRGSQLAWALCQFYARGDWVFNSCEEQHQFFEDLIHEFDSRWPVRDHMFPSIPFPAALDYTQQQEVLHELEKLRRVRDSTI